MRHIQDAGKILHVAELGIEFGPLSPSGVMVNDRGRDLGNFRDKVEAVLLIVILPSIMPATNKAAENKAIGCPCVGKRRIASSVSFFIPSGTSIPF